MWKSEMLEVDTKAVNIRPAREGDVPAIQELFTAVADGVVEAAAVRHNDLNQLLKQRSDIGLVLFRNLATGLSSKLSRTDAFLSIKPWE
jgi:hypothetical protein